MRFSKFGGFHHAKASSHLKPSHHAKSLKPTGPEKHGRGRDWDDDGDDDAQGSVGRKKSASPEPQRWRPDHERDRREHDREDWRKDADDHRQSVLDWLKRAHHGLEALKARFAFLFRQRCDEDDGPAEAAPLSWREMDGSASNADHDDWGAAHQQLLRLAPASYADGVGAMRSDLPNPRAISNAVNAQGEGESIPNAAGASDFLWIWGQFIDHDLGLTEGGHTEAAPIFAPIGDPHFDPEGDGGGIIGFHRVDPVEGTGETAPRSHENAITAFIDASMVYGSSQETGAKLRAANGYMAMESGDLMPGMAEGQPLAGDVRAAENIALTSMHTLFVREHNRLVDALGAEHPDWSGDQLYMAARMRVEAKIQAITYNEFLPLLVGEDALSEYRGYDPSVNPGIAVEFSTAAFRVGHTMLSSRLQRLEENGQDIAAGAIALRDAFFQPQQIMAHGGIDPILRGAATQEAQAIDTLIVEDVRSFLFGMGGVGFDLAALNIQRGRDLGVASYNDLREALGLERARDFSDVTADAALAAQLEAVYGDVEDIDAWVGGLAEDAFGGGLLGETFATIVIDQFERVRAGDPYWSQAGALGAEETAALWETRLSDIIRANTDIGAIQDDVFLAYDRIGGTTGSDALYGDGDRDLLIGFVGDDRLEGGDGEDHLEGGEGRDTLIGGGGNDMLVGGEGRDAFIFAGQFGDDVIRGYEAWEIVQVDVAGQWDRPGYSRAGEDLVLRFDGGSIAFEDWYAEGHGALPHLLLV